MVSVLLRTHTIICTRNHTAKPTSIYWSNGEPGRARKHDRTPTTWIQRKVALSQQRTALSAEMVMTRSLRSSTRQCLTLAAWPSRRARTCIVYEFQKTTARPMPAETTKRWLSCNHVKNEIEEALLFRAEMCGARAKDEGVHEARSGEERRQIGWIRYAVHQGAFQCMNQSMEDMPLVVVGLQGMLPRNVCVFAVAVATTGRKHDHYARNVYTTICHTLYNVVLYKTNNKSPPHLLTVWSRRRRRPGDPRDP